MGIDVSTSVLNREADAAAVVAPLAEDSTRAHVGRIVRDRYVLRIASVIAFLGIWQLIGSLVDPTFLPTPVAVAREFPGLISSGKLPEATWASMQIFLAGFLIASVIALPAGILLGRWRTASDFFETYVTVFWATPTIALLPLLVTWFGLTVTTKLIIVFLSAFWPLLINTQTGVQNVDRTYGEVVDSFGARALEHLRYVTVPATVPYIVAGLRIAIGRAIIGVIVAELYTSVSGLGSLMSFYSNYFETARYFASLATLVVVSVLFTEAVRVFEGRFSYWKS